MKSNDKREADRGSGDNWLGYPSLPYQSAFDICAMNVLRAGELAILSSSPFYSREIIKRVPRDKQVLLVTSGQERLQKEICFEINRERVAFVNYEETTEQIRMVLWAEPEQGDLRSCRTFIENNFPDGDLILITSNSLRFQLPEWSNKRRRPAVQQLGAAKTIRLLRRWGFRIQSYYGIHGPISQTYGILARFAAIVGRQDLTDQFYAEMRQSLLVSGLSARWAPISVIFAKK